ncbi:hypothetical protein Q1695_006026 [Nippostrongylus brasiliensis]|nr:hypothetical protein Q1695_006026 [Nippostrongylus brasiliensis]
MTARWHGEEDDGPPPTSPPPSPPYSSTRTHLLLSSISERSRELHGYRDERVRLAKEPLSSSAGGCKVCAYKR